MTDLNPIGLALQNTGATTANSGASDAASDQLASDFDTFLTLLTEQLKQQDPTDPMDTETFISQLVEFSSVEQLINTSNGIETLLTLQTATTQMAATDFVGREVTVSTDQAMLQNGSASWGYQLPFDASSTTLTIYDQAGRIMTSMAGETGAGQHTLDWNGRDLFGNAVADGQFQLAVEAVDANGDVLTTSITSQGLANSVSINGDNVLVDIGGLQIPAGQVIAVRNAS